jgi:alpha-2-macroglobulin
MADANGYFTLRATQKGTLVAAAVGYSTQEWPITNRFANIELPEHTNALSEVVITGYGSVRKKEVTGSVTTMNGDNLLQGKVAGLQINSGQPGLTTKITLRGVNAISDLKSPLYIVDGVPYEGNMADIDMATVVSVDVLNGTEASALYGARGANGVIILTTNNPVRMRLDSIAATTAETANALPNSLRRNFRDDGFWQPRLRTNSQGKARFTVTFPDDITKWRSFYAAMTDKRQTGITELAIRSFKPLSANLALPQFLVQGDSINIIGKVLNYNSDTATVDRKLYINGNIAKQQSARVVNARIDTIGLSINGTDSMKIKYTIEQPNGYFDGEERSIPVYVQGVQETQGLFAVLDGDTSFTLPSFNKTAAITLHAEASVIPVLLDEIDKVKKYEYLCNEQLASKLKCLLLEKKIRQQMGQPFAEDKNIKTIIEKLAQNRGRNFMWGWWANNDPSLWISLHVIEALLQAEAMGYTVGIAKQPIIDYLVYHQESFYREDKIRSLLLLQQLQAKADFKKYADSIAAHFKPNSLYQKLQWMSAQQQLGLPVNVDSVAHWPNRTLFGNLYWGEEGYRFFDNAVQNTLLAYSILRRQGGHGAMLKKIRYYFLEKRKDGQWRNTYESALILEAILPDLLNEMGNHAQPSFSISGSQSQTITQFPFTLQASATDQLTIHKKAGLPVYFTAYQQYYNPAPKKTGNGFEVSTVFESNGKTVGQLKAGQAVILKTTVQVKGDADYVMVEIPIPSGCSYKSKQQGYGNNEVHREHFKNKVSLFCTGLAKGSYTFTVELLPRYNGRYQLNPAKAEMMYFPVFYGREGMKQVGIE